MVVPGVRRTLLLASDTALRLSIEGRLRVPGAVLERHDTLVLGREIVRATSEDAAVVRVQLAEASSARNGVR